MPLVSVEHVDVPHSVDMVLPGAHRILPEALLHFTRSSHLATKCVAPLPQEVRDAQHTCVTGQSAPCAQSSCVRHPQSHAAQANPGGCVIGFTQHTLPCWPLVPLHVIGPQRVGVEVHAEPASPPVPPASMEPPLPAPLLVLLPAPLSPPDPAPLLLPVLPLLPPLPPPLPELLASPVPAPPSPPGAVKAAPPHAAPRSKPTKPMPTYAHAFARMETLLRRKPNMPV
jgi:homeobox protein ESX1